MTMVNSGLKGLNISVSRHPILVSSRITLGAGELRNEEAIFHFSHILFKQLEVLAI